MKYEREFPILGIANNSELDCLITKSIDWSYENEFRVIARTPALLGSDFDELPLAEKDFVPFPPEALKAVIVGANMPDRDKNVISTFIRESGWDVSLKVASLTPDKYSIVV